MKHKKHEGSEDEQMQKGIVLMLDILPSIEELSNEDAGAVVKGLLRHANGQDPDLPESPAARATYWLLQGMIDRMAALRETKQRAGKIGGDANAARFREKQNEAEGKQNEADHRQQGSPIPKPTPKPKPTQIPIPKKNSFFDFQQRKPGDAGYIEDLDEVALRYNRFRSDP